MWLTFYLSIARRTVNEWLDHYGCAWVNAAPIAR